jgi:TRAP-type C4-dicarboxylate transport system substrate-binding protein
LKTIRRIVMRLRGWLVGTLLIAFWVLLAVQAPALAQTKPIELKYGMHFVSTHKQAALGAEWGKEVEKRTNGRVKVTMYPGGTLIPSPQLFDGVVNGIADVGFSWVNFTRGKFPLMEVCDLPLVYRSGLAATLLVNDVYNKFKPKEFDAVQVMYMGGHGPGILHTVDKPVYKMEDLKGLRIRSTGTTSKIIKHLGGIPVAMPVGEAYDALKKGVVGGIVISLEAMEQWRLGEVCKYSIGNYGSAYTSAHYVIMNKQKWNSLSPDIQKVIVEINKEWITKTGKLWDEVDISAKEWILKRGNQFISLSKEEDARWFKAVQPVLDEYVKEAEGKGVPGKKALEFSLERLKQLQG